MEDCRQNDFVPVYALRQEVREGLFYTHVRLSQGTNKTLENSAFLYGLIDLLSEKGIITVEELDERKKIVGERLVAQLKEQGLGVLLQDPEEDKYSFESEVKIDCENRVHLCKAACCRLKFALSKQDKRIWLDFENRLVNPNICRDDWPQCEASSQTKDDQETAA